MTVLALAGALVAAAIAAPHVVRLEAAPPLAAALAWFLALALRALVAVSTAVFFVLVLPHTGVLDAVTHWCLHTVVPGLATDLGIKGHDIGDAAYLVPAALLLTSVLSVAWGTWRAGRLVGRLLHDALGPGPRDSVVIGDGSVFVAAAGLRRPQVVVSAGALTAFDDEELAASLAHERGHIQHRHRWFLLAAAGFQAVSRWLPGTRRAVRELAFHLERDADRFATRTHPPETLASAICKAAEGAPRGIPGTALADVAVTRRLRELLHGAGPERSGVRPRVLVAGMLAVVFAAAAVLPAATLAAASASGGPHAERHCAND